MLHHRGVFRPLLSLRAALSTSPITSLAAAAPPTDGEQLVSKWQALLEQHAGPVALAEVRELLQTAARLRRGRTQSFLPEQLITLFLGHYRRLDWAGREELLGLMARDFGVQPAEVQAAVQAWSAAASRAGGAGTTAALHAARGLGQASQSLFSRLLVPLGQQPGGIKAVIDLRADLLRVATSSSGGREATDREPEPRHHGQPPSSADAALLRALGEDIRGTLAEWFSVGLLQLERISWEASSAALLEKARPAGRLCLAWADYRGLGRHIPGALLTRVEPLPASRRRRR